MSNEEKTKTDVTALQAAYKQVTEREISKEGLTRFIKIKDTLKIADSDALWGVIYILEMYTRIIEEFNSKMRYALFETVKQVIMEYAKAGGTINVYGGDAREKGVSVERIMLLLGTMLFIIIAVFYAGVCIGASGSAPLWLSDRIGALNILFGIPAGWLFFIVLTIPCGLYLYDNYHEFKAMPQGKEKNISIAKYCGALLLLFLGVTILLATILNK
jgi:cell fate (sporulation/competence/biofilm development) regulator YlbF (YheA/YmcA/DUF963 family)